jgi:hypothetical protein
MARQNAVVKSRPQPPANNEDTSGIAGKYAPPSIPKAQTVRAVIAELQTQDPGGTLKAQLKALLA